MPRKIRQLIKDLTDSGFYEIQGGGKGSIGSLLMYDMRVR